MTESWALPGLSPQLDRMLTWRLLDMPLVCWRSFNQEYACAHHHPGIEFLYIHQGSGIFLSDCHSLPFTAPALVYFGSHIPHGIRVWGAYDRCCLCYVPEAIEAAFPSSHPHLPAQPVETMMVRVPARYQQRLLDIYTALAFEKEERTLFSYQIMALHLQELNLIFQRLQDTDELYNLETATGGDVTRLPGKERLAILFGLIEARMDQDLSADEIAATVHYSRSQLYRLIREVTGCSFTTYLKRRRIERAKQLLRVTNLPIAAVASRVGMPQLPQFYRAFREMTTTTPKDFRQAHTIT